MIWNNFSRKSVYNWQMLNHWMLRRTGPNRKVIENTFKMCHSSNININKYVNLFVLNFVKIIWCSGWFCTPYSFGAVNCFNCGRRRMGTCKLRNGKKTKRNEKKRKEKKNEKKTRRKATKRNEKKNETQKNENKIVRKETKQKKKKRKEKNVKKRNEMKSTEARR